MPGIIGKKIGMTRIIQDDGNVIPITLVKCDPSEVVQIKTKDKDGYPALVLGFSALKKPTKTKKFKNLKEFSLDEKNEFKKGDKVTIAALKDLKEVTVTGTSKGKGFQGFVKRHHFCTGYASHGSHHHREPGAIGARNEPGRVHPGKRMAGHMGVDTITRLHVPISYLDESENLVGLKGALPGAVNSIIYIKY